MFYFREQKAQQRHSLEIASAEAYLNMRPSTLEALTKSGNCCVHNRKRKSVRSNVSCLTEYFIDFVNISQNFLIFRLMRPPLVLFFEKNTIEKYSLQHSRDLSICGISFVVISYNLQKQVQLMEKRKLKTFRGKWFLKKSEMKIVLTKEIKKVIRSSLYLKI